MKAETVRRLAGIRSRVKDLKGSFMLELKGLGPDGTLVPRVSGIVVREGLWVCGIAKRLAEKHNVKFDTAEQKALENAELFFEELKEQHGDEVGGGGFIYRVEAAFITHLEKVSILVNAIDKKIELEKAKLEMDFDADIPDVEDSEVERAEV